MTKAAYADDELGVDVVMNADSNGIWVAGLIHVIEKTYGRPNYEASYRSVCHLALIHPRTSK